MGKKSNAVSRSKGDKKVRVFNHSLADDDVSRFQVFKTQRILRSEISGAKYNPRVITSENRKNLKKLLEGHGLVEPLVFNQRTGTMVSGHQRISIIDALEGTDQYYLDFAVIDVPPHKEAEINVALNNTSSMGEFDFDKLNDVRSTFPDMDLGAAGFSDLEIDTLFPDGGIFENVIDGASGEAKDEAADFAEQIEEGRKDKGYFDKRDGKEPSEEEIEENKKEFKKHKNGPGHNVDSSTSDFYIMLMFSGPDQKKAFNRLCEIGEGSTYIRLDDVKDALGLDL